MLEQGDLTEARVDAIVKELRRVEGRTVVVGSSFGGLAAVCALAVPGLTGQAVGLVLCAPALNVQQAPAAGRVLAVTIPTIIVPGTRDRIIPIEVSREFAARTGCEIVERDDDHSLAASLDAILAAVDRVGQVTTSG